MRNLRIIISETQHLDLVEERDGANYVNDREVINSRVGKPRYGRYCGVRVQESESAEIEIDEGVFNFDDDNLKPIGAACLAVKSNSLCANVPKRANGFKIILLQRIEVNEPTIRLDDWFRSETQYLVGIQYCRYEKR